MTTGLVADPAELLRGSVASGQRAAAGFVSVPWVRDQLREVLGRDPFPGTLNVHVREPQSLGAWRRLASSDAGLTLPAAEPGFCDSRAFPVLLNGTVPCAVVLPRVPGYPADVLELVAGEGLRERLGLRDGDEVCIEWAPAYRVSEPTVSEPTVSEPTVAEPTVAECTAKARDDSYRSGPGPAIMPERGAGILAACADPAPHHPTPNDGGRRGPS